MKRIKVLFVSHTVLMAGANRSMLRLIQELRADYDVDPVVIMPQIHKNYKKWNNIKNNTLFVNELSEPARKCKTEKEAADFLLDWLNSRIEFLNDQWHS